MKSINIHRNINLIFCLVFIFLLFPIVESKSAAIESGAATTYNITINKIELCTSSACSSPLTIGSSAKAFDIASASVGAELGSYAPLNSIPKGTTVTHVRVTMSRSIGIAGETSGPDGAVSPLDGTTAITNCGTDANDATVVNGTTPGVGIYGTGGTPGAGAGGLTTLFVPNDDGNSGATYTAAGITLSSATEMQILASLGSPITMGDIPPLIDIAFETAAGVQAYAKIGGGCSMVPGAPIVSITATEFD